MPSEVISEPSNDNRMPQGPLADCVIDMLNVWLSLEPSPAEREAMHAAVTAAVRRA